MSSGISVESVYMMQVDCFVRKKLVYQRQRLQILPQSFLRDK